MKRSELEIHIQILQVLAQRSPLKITHIMHKANLNSNASKKCLALLIKQGLVEKRIEAKLKVSYVITQRGITVLKYFRELKQALPIIEETKNRNIFL